MLSNASAASSLLEVFVRREEGREKGNERKTVRDYSDRVAGRAARGFVGESRALERRARSRRRAAAHARLHEGHEREPPVFLRRLLERDVHVLDVPEGHERRVQHRVGDLLVQAACAEGKRAERRGSDARRGGGAGHAGFGGDTHRHTASSSGSP